VETLTRVEASSIVGLRAHETTIAAAGWPPAAASEEESA
jgi:hypothetical protein